MKNLPVLRVVLVSAFVGTFGVALIADPAALRILPMNRSNASSVHDGQTGETAVIASDDEPNRPTAQSTSEPASSAGKPASSDHWSFQTITDPAIPAVRNTKWCRTDLDHFILARLEREEFTPNDDADRHTLLRRIAFDLTGLPPTLPEIDAFVSDPRPIESVLTDTVDRMLASPRFGERWGRHWLDTVRYADSVGRNWNAPFTYAWRYRDYVIDSLNKNKPHDRFLTEQLAGDLLDAESVNARRNQLIATGFLALGAMDIIKPEGESLMMDRIDEQIDVITRSFMGLTVACARCHDHKYEPVTMRDYYALAGIFYSTDTRSGQRRGNYVAADDLLLLPTDRGPSRLTPGVHSMADMTREHRRGGWREVLWSQDPNLSMAAIDAQIRDCPVRIDGESFKRGETPPRGDFQIAGLSGPGIIPANASGRLELARWITSRDHPLTSRVMVNRVWHHLFGRGLVETVDNFGVSGTVPTHPELLDHLANQFRKDWSLKSLIRTITLSRTYRLSSQSTGVTGIDPQNLLYGRGQLRRLELEAVRDSILSISGSLSFERPTGIQVAGTGGKGKWGATRSLLPISVPYRTVYLPVLRSLLPEMYTGFDFPNPTQVIGRREVTTVATQALFLMNSDFVMSESRKAAARLLSESFNDDRSRVQVVWMRILGRPPEPDEQQSAFGLLNEVDADTSSEQRWAILIQALLMTGEFRTLL